MHILRTSAPIATPSGFTLDPGEWLVQDTNAFELALMGERGTVSVSVAPESLFYKNFPKGDSPKSILLIRSGAIGDLLLLSPCIAQLKAKYPNAEIYLACFQKHWPIFDGLTDGLVGYPVRADCLQNFDLIIPLENIVELSTEKGQHATDAYAEALGVTVTDYRPVYQLTAQENNWKATEWPRHGKKRIALQLHASTPIRDYPMANWMAVMNELVARGWEIMLLGNRDGLKNPPPMIHDCSRMTFREAAAVLSTCDVFCGVDSAFFNLCPALGVPAVGLFGPVDWRTRIKEGNGQVALHGDTPCAPCGWTNSRGGRRWPENGPCNAKNQCVPLADISPARVVAVIEREAKK